MTASACPSSSRARVVCWTEFEAFSSRAHGLRASWAWVTRVVSLVEKAAEAVSEEDAKRMEEKMRKGQFTLEDFLEQLRYR